jgi:hypothetical protein
MPKRNAKGVTGSIGVAAILCLLISAAPVQSQEGPLIPNWKQSHLQEADTGIRSVYVLAVCARTERREAVEALLRTAPGSAEQSALMSTVFPSGETECPIRTTRLTIRSMDLVRGAVAEAVYNGDGLKPVTDSPLPFTEAFEVPRPYSPMQVARFVAKCSVHRSPMLSHRVVRYNVGAPGEERALRALKETFTGCLPAGERLRINRLGMRALIAEELYQASRQFAGAFTNA